MHIQLPSCRKRFGLSLSFVAILLFFPLTGIWADSVVINGLQYSSIDDDKASVAAVDPENLSGSIVIPSTVTFNDGKKRAVTEIAEQGFKFAKISSIELPATLEAIGKDAFFRCLSLASIIIPPTVSYIGVDAFYYCSSLEYIHVMAGNEIFRNVGKAVVNKFDYIVVYPGKGDVSLVIPEGIRGICDRAFDGCQSIEEVFIPASVEEIGNMAFLFCQNLRRVLWNASASTVSHSCFHGCESLEEVVLSENVSTIGYMSFISTTLKSLTLLNPNPVMWEGDPCFSTSGWYYNAYPNCTVYVPQGSLGAYRSDANWTNFSNIKELDGSKWQRTHIVQTRDGGTMEYLLAEGTVLTYELENMSQLRYGRRHLATGIHGEAIVNGQAFRMNEGNLFFDDLRQNSLIEIYTVDGKMLSSRRASGQTQVSLGQLPTGVYFVKVNGESYKILKK